MWDFDAFGCAGRTGGVDYISQIIRTVAVDRILFTLGGDYLCISIKAEQSSSVLRQGIEQMLLCQQRRDTGIFEHER